MELNSTPARIWIRLTHSGSNMEPPKFVPNTVQQMFLLARRLLPFFYSWRLTGGGCPCLLDVVPLRPQRRTLPRRAPWVTMLHSGSDRLPRQVEPMDIQSEKRGEADWRTLGCWLSCFPTRVVCVSQAQLFQSLLSLPGPWQT